MGTIYENVIATQRAAGASNWTFSASTDGSVTADTTAATRTGTVPAAASVPKGTRFTGIKPIAANSMIFARSGADTIDGVAGNYTFGTGIVAACTIESDGVSAWYVVADAGSTGGGDQQPSSEYFVDTLQAADASVRRYASIAAALAAAAAELGAAAQGVIITMQGNYDDYIPWDGSGLGAMFVTIRGPNPEVVFLDLDGGDIAGTGQVWFDRVDISGLYTISHPLCGFTECHFSSTVTLALGSSGSFSQCYSIANFVSTGACDWSFYNCTLLANAVAPFVSGAFNNNLRFFNCVISNRTTVGGNFIVGAAGAVAEFWGCTISLNDANAVLFNAGTVHMRSVQFAFEAGFTYTFKSGAGVTYGAPVSATVQGVPIASLITPPAGIWVNDGANAIVATP